MWRETPRCREHIIMSEAHITKNICFVPTLTHVHYIYTIIYFIIIVIILFIILYIIYNIYINGHMLLFSVCEDS
mgnify:CR=1 FL=1|jgi:hypothetical protein